MGADIASMRRDSHPRQRLHETRNEPFELGRFFAGDETDATGFSIGDRRVLDVATEIRDIAGPVGAGLVRVRPAQHQGEF